MKNNFRRAVAMNRTDEPTTSLLTAKQVAALMQISTRTVWRLLSAGELIEPLRIRGNTRWRRSELERWIDEGCPSPPTVEQ